jgi:steroid 5-alpha reductase family enzyme
MTLFRPIGRNKHVKSGEIMSASGGVNRDHSRSIGAKTLFAALHCVSVAGCLWLAFGVEGWADPFRARLLAGCALLYLIRHLVTLFVLLQRKVDLGEVLGLSLFIAVFEIGFLLLGAGVVSGTSTPFVWLDGAGIALLIAGSFLNTGSELQRRAWKKKPASKGRCYTGGLFAYSMHINYFGDTVLFTGWALLTASVFAAIVPVFMTLSFVFYHIPALDSYLAERYGAEFKAYAERTAKFVPFLY